MFKIVLIIIGLIILVFLGLFVVLAISATIKRNKRLDEWAKSVPISEEQQIAMDKLWAAFKLNLVPEIDPLSKISKADLEYLKTICSPQHRPEEFGSGESIWLAIFLSQRKKGYSLDQAVIIAGMGHNRVGRRDI